MIVNLTNDAWFGQGTAPYQHESHLRLRAIETRVGIVRAANTGISEYIDPLGRSFGALPLFVSGTAAYMAQTTALRSPYVVIGDWAAIACVATTLILVGVAFVRRRAAART
jgi:apolipoprotein N-acyltransferase